MTQRIMAGAIALFFFTLFSFSNPQPVGAADLAAGEQIFEVQCAGCHAGGGNIIRRRKTLKQKALHRNGVDSIEEIASLVRNGKNNMSAFADRLSPQEIEAVSAYVWEQAQQGW